MSKSNYAENAWMAFECNATAMPSWGANLGVALHTADPGENGLYTTNACAYTNYAPITVSRDVAGLTLCDGTNPYAANASGNAYKNAAQMTFPTSDPGYVGPETATHVSIYDIGTGKILRSTALTVGVIIGPNATPLFPAGTLVWAED